MEVKLWPGRTSGRQPRVKRDLTTADRPRRAFVWLAGGWLADKVAGGPIESGARYVGGEVVRRVNDAWSRRVPTEGIASNALDACILIATVSVGNDRTRATARPLG